jgi:hypothetical protein
MWLPALGAVLFMVAGLAWATSSPSAPAGAAASASATAASAAPSAAPQAAPPSAGSAASAAPSARPLGNAPPAASSAPLKIIQGPPAGMRVNGGPATGPGSSPQNPKPTDVGARGKGAPPKPAGGAGHP